MIEPREAWRLTEAADGRLVWQVPDGWQQGRGAYGGLVTAALVEGLETVSRGRPLRTLMATLCGPAMVGEATLTAEALREGGRLSAASVTLRQADGVVAHAVGVYGEPRADRREWLNLPRPTGQPWGESIDMPEGVGPTFTRHFEYQPQVGFPHTGDPPFSAGWVRLRGATGPVDAALIVALIDAWWPAAFVTLPEFRPMGTVSTTIDLCPVPEGLDACRPTWLAVRLLAGAEGYLVEQRELWTEDGRLLAINHQTQALIR